MSIAGTQSLSIGKFSQTTISLAVLGGLLFPYYAMAMTIADIQALFQPKAQALTTTNRSPSVQTMQVLEARTSPVLAKGGGDILIVDDSAVLPDEGPAGSMADIGKPKNTQIAIYVVKEGDTLSGIAQLFDVSVNTIKWANDISPKGTIRVGQTLTILPVTGINHTVKKGDTLASLAKQYHGDAEEIANYNDIEGPLVVGNEILIPNGEIAAPPAPKKSSTPSSLGSVSSGSTSYAGYYMRPLIGGTRTQGVHGYNGVDLAASIGTPLLASAAGEVIIAKEGGWNGGYGSYVVIKHANGSQTLYAHASSVIVGVGQQVSQGENIGSVGQTGKATGPHVHFEIRGGPRNPF